MEVKFYSPNIVVTEDADKLLSTLNETKTKYSKKNGIIFFNAKLTKDSPEFTVNVRYLENRVLAINMGYNYKNNSVEFEQKHKESLTNYMLSNYGESNKHTTDEKIGRDSYKWFMENESITYNFNGAGFNEEYRRETDIFLQFIFTNDSNVKFTAAQLIKICVIAGVLLAAVLCLYFVAYEELELKNILISVGSGLGSIIVFYVIGRFIMGGYIYSEKEIQIGEKMFAEFEKEKEIEAKYHGKLLIRNIMGDSLAKGRIYITKDKLIITRLGLFKIKTVEVEYKNFKQIEVKRNVLIFKFPNNKKKYFEVKNELVADEIYKVFKLHIKK